MSDTDYRYYYETDSEVHTYVDRYCTTYEKSVERALQDRIVREYIGYKIGFIVR